MGRLWKELHLQSLARHYNVQQGLIVLMSQQTNKQANRLKSFLKPYCVTLKVCALALYVCLPLIAGS